MTELIKTQLTVIGAMLCCGACGGMIHDAFRCFELTRKVKALPRLALEMIYYITLGVLYSEFSFFCENGKLSFTGLFSFIVGLLLWKKIFCGILLVGERNEKKEKQSSRIRKK